MHLILMIIKSRLMARSRGGTAERHGMTREVGEKRGTHVETSETGPLRREAQPRVSPSPGPAGHSAHQQVGGARAEDARPRRRCADSGDRFPAQMHLRSGAGAPPPRAPPHTPPCSRQRGHGLGRATAGPDPGTVAAGAPRPAFPRRPAPPRQRPPQEAALGTRPLNADCFA